MLAHAYKTASSWRGLVSFPPPRHLQMNAFGINISDHSIKLLELEKWGHTFILGEHADKSLQDGIVVRGDVKDRNALIARLSELKKESGLSFVRVSIPEEKAYIFSTELPDLRGEEIEEALEFQLAEHVPLTSEEAIFDYEIVYKDARTNGTLVTVSVLPRIVAEEYLGIFSQAGLTALSFEIEAQTIARAVVPKDEQGVNMIVDVGRTRTGISIVDRGIVGYTSTLTVGGDELTRAVSEHLSVSMKEADEIKQERGFTYGTDSGALREKMINSTLALREEMEKRITYWSTHRTDEKKKIGEVKSVYLCGGNATIPGFREHLASSMNIEVEIADVWVNTLSGDVVPDIEFKKSLGFASAIGLAMSSEM